MAQDAIDQFIAMPKDERGKLFEQLAPAKQQSLLAEIKKRKGGSLPASTDVVGPGSYTPVADRSIGGEYGPYYKMKAGAKIPERERFEMTYPVGHAGEPLAESVGNVFQNAGVGMFSAISHPVKAAESVVASLIPKPALEALFSKKRKAGTLTAEDQAVIDTPNPIKGAYDMLTDRPGEQIPNALGQAAVLGKLTEVPERAGTLRALRETSRNMRGKLVRALREPARSSEELVKKKVAEKEIAAGKLAKLSRSIKRPCRKYARGQRQSVE